MSRVDDSYRRARQYSYLCQYSSSRDRQRVHRSLLNIESLIELVNDHAMDQISKQPGMYSLVPAES